MTSHGALGSDKTLEAFLKRPNSAHENGDFFVDQVMIFVPLDVRLGFAKKDTIYHVVSKVYIIMK